MNNYLMGTVKGKTYIIGIIPFVFKQENITYHFLFTPL